MSPKGPRPTSLMRARSKVPLLYHEGRTSDDVYPRVLSSLSQNRPNAVMPPPFGSIQGTIIAPRAFAFGAVAMP